jgi:hypothetical protein
MLKTDNNTDFTFFGFTVKLVFNACHCRLFEIYLSFIFFMPCHLVRHFHVLQFHTLLYGPPISCSAISCPVIWSAIFMSCNFIPCYMVRQFHVLQFHVRHFQSTRQQQRTETETDGLLTLPSQQIYGTVDYMQFRFYCCLTTCDWKAVL